MASIYAPTVTVSPTPFIGVDTTTLTNYEEVLESQGNVVYQATSLYYQAQSLEQINEPIEIETYYADGSTRGNKRINLTDVNQSQFAKNIDLKKDPIVFDGRTRLNLNLKPNEDIKLYFQTFQLESSDVLNGGYNFFNDDFSDTYGFFEDFDDEIKERIEKVKDELENPKDDCIE